MIIAEWYHIPTFVSLGVIALVLAVSIWLSIRKEAGEELAAAQRAAPGSGEGSGPDPNRADGPVVAPDTPAEATQKPGASS